MTPLEISILLHIYCRPTPIENGWSSAQKNAVDRFLSDDLIASTSDNPCGYRLTPRGTAYINFLQMMPLPTANWSLGGWKPTFTPEYAAALSADQPIGDQPK